MNDQDVIEKNLRLMNERLLKAEAHLCTASRILADVRLDAHPDEIILLKIEEHYKY